MHVLLWLLTALPLDTMRTNAQMSIPHTPFLIIPLYVSIILNQALVRRHDKEHYYWRMSTKERQTALEEVEKEGLPIYFFFGKHRDAAIPTVMSTPQDETYITNFMAGKPGFFQTCTSK